MIIHYNCVCLLANSTFQIYRYKATNCQHSSKRRHCLVTRRLLSRGVVCANAHAYAMACLRGLGMLNQQKGVQQDTAYSAVIEHDHN